jgi:ATP-GRASP peptide maturase of grasp-with-spasm system
MILISSSSIDISTNTVIDWIFFFDYTQKILRINDDSNYDIKFNGKNIDIVVAEKAINIDSFKSFWYRRGRIRYKSSSTIFSNLKIKEDEEKVLEEYIHYILKRKNCINDYFNSESNKLIVLEEARNNGLNVPESFLCQDKKSVSKINLSEELITKTISESSMIVFQDKTSVIYTSVVNKKTIPNLFSPSLIQNRIKKKYELRIFYFNNKLWTMAIFSQTNSKTSVDYKQYNRDKPNRTIPYQLPDYIDQKLRKFINNMKYDSCSVDMIVTEENQFIFLEINPIGQFGMVSIPCNYHFEKEIAKYLMHGC